MNESTKSGRGLPLRFWLALIGIAIVMIALGAWLAPHLSRERVEGWVRAAGPWGPILTSVGTIIGSTAAYWVGRSAGHEVAERWVGAAALEKAHDLLRGRRWLALVPIFLVPFSPADAICFVAGIVSVPWIPFTIAVLVGRLPRDAALAAGVALGWSAIFSPR